MAGQCCKGTDAASNPRPLTPRTWADATANMRRLTSCGSNLRRGEVAPAHRRLLAMRPARGPLLLSNCPSPPCNRPLGISGLRDSALWPPITPDRLTNHRRKRQRTDSGPLELHFGTRGARGVPYSNTDHLHATRIRVCDGINAAVNSVNAVMAAYRIAAYTACIVLLRR